MLKCKCGNIVDIRGKEDFIISVCPACAMRPENAEYMKELNEFCNRPSNDNTSRFTI